jgi:hypothetical protein
MTAINAMLVYLLGAVGPHLLRIAVVVVVASALTGGLFRRLGLADSAATTLVRAGVLVVALSLIGAQLWDVLLQAADAGLQWWPVLATGSSPGAPP